MQLKWVVMQLKALFLMIYWVLRQYLGANKLEDFVDGVANRFLGAIAELFDDLLLFVNVVLSPVKGTNDKPASFDFCC